MVPVKKIFGSAVLLIDLMVATRLNVMTNVSHLLLSPAAPLLAVESTA
jgi:hypothetical protein